MEVDETEPETIQFVPRNEFVERFLIGDGQLWQTPKDCNGGMTHMDRAGDQFSGNEGMATNPSVHEQGLQVRIRLSEVVDPDGRIDEDHQTNLRLGAAWASGIVPPSAMS